MQLVSLGNERGQDRGGAESAPWHISSTYQHSLCLPSSVRQIRSEDGSEGAEWQDRSFRDNTGLSWRVRMEAEVRAIWRDELRGEKWVVVVVDAVEKELPALKIACASAERTEKECKRESEGGRDCGRATVLLCLPAGLIWSPVRLYSSLVSKEFTLTTAALQLIIQDCFLWINAWTLVPKGHRPAVPLKQIMCSKKHTKHHWGEGLVRGPTL